MAGKFEIAKDKAGKYRFRLKAGNGEIIAVSEAYETIARCRYAGSRSPAPRGNASPSMSAARPTLRFVLPGPALSLLVAARFRSRSPPWTRSGAETGSAHASAISAGAGCGLTTPSLSAPLRCCDPRACRCVEP